MVFDGSLEIVIAEHAGFSLLTSQNRLDYSEGIFLGGQISQRISLELKPGARLIFIKVDPWVLGPSSHRPLHELQNRCTPLLTVLPDLHRRLVRLRPGTSPALIEMVINHWIETESRRPEKAALAAYAVRQLSNTADEPKRTKRQLLEALSISSRTLEGAFATMVGIPPTRFATLARLRAITEKLIYEGTPDSLTRVAMDHGFFDQAHFSRAIKTFSGTHATAITDQALFVPNSQEGFRIFTIQ